MSENRIRNVLETHYLFDTSRPVFEGEDLGFVLDGDAMDKYNAVIEEIKQRTNTYPKYYIEKGISKSTFCRELIEKVKHDRQNS